MALSWGRHVTSLALARLAAVVPCRFPGYRASSASGGLRRYYRTKVALSTFLCVAVVLFSSLAMYKVAQNFTPINVICVGASCADSGAVTCPVVGIRHVLPRMLITVSSIRSFLFTRNNISLCKLEDCTVWNFKYSIGSTHRHRSGARHSVIGGRWCLSTGCCRAWETSVVHGVLRFYGCNKRFNRTKKGVLD